MIRIMPHAQRVPSVYICILIVNFIKMLLVPVEELQLECPGCGSNFEMEMVVANDTFSLQFRRRPRKG